MANTFYIKRNDTSPKLTQTLSDAAGDAVVLTGASVNLHVFTRRNVSVINAAMTITVVQYTFTAMNAGNYNYEIEVTYADTSVETFPNVGFDLLVVERDLA